MQSGRETIERETPNSPLSELKHLHGRSSATLVPAERVPKSFLTASFFGLAWLFGEAHAAALRVRLESLCRCTPQDYRFARCRWAEFGKNIALRQQ